VEAAAQIINPEQAALNILKPPAPATPIDVIDVDNLNASAIAVHAFASPAVAARHKIEATLLALARDIRRPSAYVGYSAFILMALRYKCQPCVWEGAEFIDLLKVFAPWAKEHCTIATSVAAIPCALIPKPGGAVQCVPISEEHPLSKTCHFVGGIQIPETAVAEDTNDFEMFYAQRGVATLSTVINGSCGIDVMTMMLGVPSSDLERTAIRIAISDYLMPRINELWMQQIMAACQELDHKDLALASEDTQCLGVPLVPPSAVAEPVAQLADPQEAQLAVPVDEETFNAMRWASKLDDDANVLSLIRSLPNEIVVEQVRAYRNRDETAVAEAAKSKLAAKVTLSGSSPLLRDRMVVCARFHTFCKRRCITPDKKLPYGMMQTFMKEHVMWKAGNNNDLLARGRQVRRWYRTWLTSETNAVAAVADTDAPHVRAEMVLLRSRARKKSWTRLRAPGAGRPTTAPMVRQSLYEWWSSIRHCIDWTQLAEDRRSRGKKHLARFPRSVLALKVHQLLQDFAYASLINGIPVVAFKPDSWWFKRWEDDYGLSMRKANRKYQVARPVLKERLEVFLVNLFRLRLFCMLVWGYDPLIINWDQSPFHHNETGSQNKPILGVKGDIVPVCEGNSDTKCRWTANLTTKSKFTAVAGGEMPFAECMFKGASGEQINTRLQNFLRDRGFPSWFTVTVGPSGSYCEEDIISFLRKHLEVWKEGRDWRILLADDYSAHKSDNVWSLCWQRGYIILIHGGGATPVGQTVDTDLNEHVRRQYGNKEARLLIEKMRGGHTVPKLSQEECMLLMLEVLSDPQVHKDASAGYKKVGQSVDLYGSEDSLICREAGTFWNEETTDGFTSMRPKINSELAAVAEECEAKGITWCQDDIKRLITAYTPRRKTDQIIARLGEDFYHDATHAALDDGDDAIAEGETPYGDSDDSDDDHAGHVDAAVAGDACADDAGLETIDLEYDPISVAQAEKVHHCKSTMAALQAMIASLKTIGNIAGLQALEAELSKERRRERQLVGESPAVADTFLRMRKAEHQDDLERRRIATQQNALKRDASQAMVDRDAAVAELKKTRKVIQDMERTREATHAIKTFTLDALGAGIANAGGAKARNKRYEVLDRLSRMNAGLSAGQRNDWLWFKEAWDQQMVADHGANWAATFSGWVQGVLNDTRSNAFSVFMYTETSRVFSDSSALHVPGS
jgi:hypothetical protein